MDFTTQVYNRALQLFGQQRNDPVRHEQAMAALEATLARYPFFSAQNDGDGNGQKLDNGAEGPGVPNFEYFAQKRRAARQRNIRNE